MRIPCVAGNHPIVVEGKQIPATRFRLTVNYRIPQSPISLPETVRMEVGGWLHSLNQIVREFQITVHSRKPFPQSCLFFYPATFESVGCRVRKGEVLGRVRNLSPTLGRFGTFTFPLTPRRW